MRRKGQLVVLVVCDFGIAFDGSICVAELLAVDIISGSILDCRSTDGVIDPAPRAWFIQSQLISPGCPRPGIASWYRIVAYSTIHSFIHSFIKIILDTFIYIRIYPKY